MTELFVSQVTHLEPRFKVKALPLALTLLSAALVMPAHALETISDSDMSDATAEGVAFIPQNFRMILQGASAPDAMGSVTAASLADRTLDTGYIRYIPVGPLSAAALASQTNADYNSDGVINASDKVDIGKSDLYLYGLGISQSEAGVGVGRTSAQWNSRYNATASGLIGSLGSYLNPWVLRVKTDPVPDFAGTTQQLPYLQLEAPLYTTSTLASLSSADKAQYNLKLGFWADSLVRDPSKVEGDVAQFDLGGAGRANRLRLQGIWDGFSLNGSKLQLFQTLGGATNTGGLSTSYNNTLGLAGVIRLNSGDASNLKATKAASAVTRQSVTTTNVYSTTYTGAPGAAPTDDQLYQVRNTQTVDVANGITWTPPALTSVFRLSTQETSNTGLTTTPGVNGGSAPTFALDEGLFFYNLNVNLVLGGLAQPLTFGVAADGRNIVLEIARIPNNVNVYKNIYTRYQIGGVADAGDAGVTYTGSTCNIYQCGTSAIAGYQGNSATHSSITVGTTNYSGTGTEASGKNLLTAYNGDDAVGISFGALAPYKYTAYYNQLEYRARARSTNARWTYTPNAATGAALGTNNCATTAPNNCYEFAASAAAGWISAGSVDGLIDPRFTTNGYTVTGRTATSNFIVPTFGPIAGANYSGTTWTSNPAPVTPVAYTVGMGSSPLNNLGSGVIDGLLIQHLKFTTTGL